MVLSRAVTRDKCFSLQSHASLRPKLPISRKGTRRLVQAPLCYKSAGNETSAQTATDNITQRRAEEVPSASHKKVLAFTGLQ